ncbi:MAG: NAD-dependent epimerase/dehydratase family protein [Actinobacteria bacterium]|nr:NAD-dependent epimerase/dehydratase family protein [Actinomycetota bacterium]
MSRVLVTGGAGYVGAVLVPRLLQAGHEVTVVDLYLYGEDVLAESAGDPRLREVRGDIRDEALLERELRGCDAVIHLACISNDPSFELDPSLGKSINYDAFAPLVRAAKRAGVSRFVYASSSSVYGVKDVPDVTEDMELEPLTDYSKYKAMCEDVLLAERSPGFVPLVLRPATVCGWSPRLRLDLTVNILTNHGFHNHLIKVFGGPQLRPNIHVEDMADLYVLSLRLPDEQVDGRVLNAGYENHSVDAIAGIVQHVLGPDIEIERTPTDDMRSYHISSDRIRRELGFVPKRTIEDAVRDLVRAFQSDRVPGAMDDSRYYNVRRMQELSLS